MKACIYTPEKSEVKWSTEELALPTPAADQVQVKVLAASINPIDLALPVIPIVQKDCPGRPIGFDFAGEVTIGSGEYKKGDLVYGVARQGSFCEYTVADVSRIARIPKGMSPVVAASLPVATLVGYQALRDYGILSPGKSVLIIGASGGTGASAVQIAKASGAKVYAVCSGRNADYVKSLGADVVLDYTKDGFQLPNDQCPDGTVDMVYDCVTSMQDMNYEPTARGTLKEGGMYVCTNATNLNDWMAFFVDRLVPFSVQRPNYSLALVDCNTKDLNDLSDMVNSGKLHIQIKEVPFTAEGCKEAVDAIVSRKIRGKVVIKM